MRLAWVLTVAVLGGGCGLILDLDPPDRAGIDGGARDGGEDAGPRPDAGRCEGAQDGTVCDTAGRICLDEQCVRGRCGDGFVSAGEECDDGNTLSGDGCEPTCQHTCDTDADCGAADPRCAAVTCSPEHVCVSTFVADNTSCALAGANVGRCRRGICVPATCGDGVVDLATGEECDNDTEGDGCRPDCTLICDPSTGCSDGVTCNGTERCETELRSDGQTRAVCLPAESPPALRPCFACDLVTGTAQLAGDEDGDGFSSLPGCDNGQDCDDTDPNVYPGAPDFMFGDGRDNDCDGSVDEDAITSCYPDMDGDGFGAGEPMVIAADTACPAGSVPARPRMDCDDTDPDVFPGQTAWFNTSRCSITEPTGTLCWDYNCDGSEELRWPREVACLDLLDRCDDEEGWGVLGSVRVPPCGAMGAWARCNRVLLSCLPSLATSRRQQMCR